MSRKRELTGAQRALLMTRPCREPKEQRVVNHPVGQQGLRQCIGPATRHQHGLVRLQRSRLRYNAAKPSGSADRCRRQDNGRRHTHQQPSSHRLETLACGGTVTDQVNALNKIDAFVPPKPKLLDSATEIGRSCACFATLSITLARLGSSRLSVGGATRSRTARIEKIASIAP